MVQNAHPIDLSLKGVMGENAKSSAATFFGAPQSLISLKSVEKTLQIKDFIKRNWTPIKIRIVSKLVSSYCRGDGSKNSSILPISTAFLTRTKPSKINGFRAFRRMQLHIHNFTNWFYRVQIVHGFRFHNRHLGTPIAQILTEYNQANCEESSNLSMRRLRIS